MRTLTARFTGLEPPDYWSSVRTKDLPHGAGDSPAKAGEPPSDAARWSLSPRDAYAFGQQITVPRQQIIAASPTPPSTGDLYDLQAVDDIAPPRSPLHPRHLQGIALLSLPIFLSLTSLRDGIFERTKQLGFHYQGSAAAKCALCGNTLSIAPTSGDACQRCGCSAFYAPSAVEKERVQAFLGQCNMQGHSMMDVLEWMQWDVSSLDDCWAVRKKSYVTDENGLILDWHLSEVYRANPVTMRFLLRQKDGHVGGTWVCIDPAHRAGAETEGQKFKKPGRCPKCNRLLYEAKVVEMHRDRTPRAYYVAGEYWHRSVFAPSETYGVSPLIPSYVLIRCLLNIERQQDKYYELGRIPNQLMLTPTDNIEGTRAMMEQIRQMAAEDKFFVPIWPFKPGPSGDWKPSKLDLDRPPAEMLMLEWMDMARRLIASLWGVMPLMSGDSRVGGALNSQDRQLTVFQRRVRQMATLHNEFLRVIAKDLRCEWWLPQIQPPEAKDVAREIQLAVQKAGAIEAWRTAGHDVYLDQEGDIRVSPRPVISVREHHEFRVGKPNSRNVPGDVVDSARQLADEESILAAQSNTDYDAPASKDASLPASVNGREKGKRNLRFPRARLPDTRAGWPDWSRRGA